MTRIIVVDDHPVVAEGWSRVTRHLSDCEIVYTATPLRAFQVSREKPPDLLVVDLSFGDERLAGIKYISRLRLYDRRVPVLVFSMHRSAVLVREAFRAGANGFVNKDASPEDISTAFTTVLAGGRYLAPDIATRLAFLDLSTPGEPAPAALTAREVEVLSLIATGKSYREIAQISCVSYKTVLNIGHALRTKLSANSLPDLVVKAVEFFEPR